MKKLDISKIGQLENKTKVKIGQIENETKVKIGQIENKTKVKIGQIVQIENYLLLLDHDQN